jgi:hypothetical protein
MAKPLVFEFRGKQSEYQLIKVDRTKLYGYKELEVIDDQGNRCDFATLAEDGHTLVGKGGVGMGYLSADGLWCDKTKLSPVDAEGKPIQPAASSYAAPVVISEQNLTSADDYLAHTIRAIYLLATAELGQLDETIKQGSIFKFPYSFRGGLEPDVAFLLANDAGFVFLAVGRPALIEFIGLQQIAHTVEEELSDDEVEEMDFGMI